MGADSDASEEARNQGIQGDSPENPMLYNSEQFVFVIRSVI
jgi:hypothetical protein